MIDGGAIGPVNCRIRHREDGQVTCETHAVVFERADPEEIRAHIEESNKAWHRQQEFLDGLAKLVTEPDWKKIAADPERAGAEFLKTQREAIEILRQQTGLAGGWAAHYHLQFQDGDHVVVDFMAPSLEELRVKAQKVRDVFRSWG